MSTELPETVEADLVASAVLSAWVDTCPAVLADIWAIADRAASTAAVS